MVVLSSDSPGGTTKRPFLKIPGAPARRGNASPKLAKKGPVFENSWRPCEARQGLAESLFFPSPALPASLRIPAPGSPPYSGSRILSPPGRKILIYPNQFFRDWSNRWRISKKIKRKTIQMIEANGFHEYYSRKTAKPMGAKNFSWSAALYLDLKLNWN